MAPSWQSHADPLCVLHKSGQKWASRASCYKDGEARCSCSPAGEITDLGSSCGTKLCCLWEGATWVKKIKLLFLPSALCLLSDFLLHQGARISQLGCRTPAKIFSSGGGCQNWCFCLGWRLEPPILSSCWCHSYLSFPLLTVGFMCFFVSFLNPWRHWFDNVLHF